MIVSQTPLRISLLGGGTDFPGFYKKHGGAVLGLAINKYIYVVVKERFDDLIYVNYSKKEITQTVDELEHELVRETMRLSGVMKGVEITTLADIPSEGSGLGSSSTVTVGLLNALNAHINNQVNNKQLRDDAIRIEIGTLKKPIGVQDQTIAAHGNLNFLEFKTSGEICVQQHFVPRSVADELVENLMLFYTNRTRGADNILAKQSRKIDTNLAQLQSLARLAYEARDAIIARDFDRIGYLMHEGWVIKKSLAEGIADPQINEMYDKALGAGAIGGKIAGAGGGGFLLVYCHEKNRTRVREALLEYKELKFGLSYSGSKIAFNANL